MTNFEKIKQMTVEEMVWLLMDFKFDGYAYANGSESVLQNSQAKIKEYLESEAEE